jgi:hypothetical protein
MPSERGQKILLLSDSGANPRSFPASMAVQLEQTYPYLLRAKLPGSTFYQLSFGNIATEDLVSQATAYLTHWRPNFVVVQSGLVDARPEAFTEAQKAIINRLPGRLFGTLKKNVNRAAWVKRRQVYRVPEQSFRKTIKKFKLVFSSSKVLWLQICVGAGYESERPGIGARIAEYNAILREIYGENLVSLQKVVDIGGFNQDHTHFTVGGHQFIADAVLDKIQSIGGATAPSAAAAPKIGAAGD